MDVTLAGSFLLVYERFCVPSSALLQPVHWWSHTTGQRQVVCGAVKVARGNNSLLNDTAFIIYLHLKHERHLLQTQRSSSVPL